MPEEPNNYAETHSRREVAYVTDFQKWIASLTPEERAKADALGVGKPHVDSQGAGSPELDADRIADHSYEENFDYDSPEPEVDIEDLIRRAIRKSTRALVCEILDAKNARLSTECIALVTGVGYLGISETTIAKKFNVSRAAVSKRCVELCEKLGLPPARAMKSEVARGSYRKSRLKVVAENDGRAWKGR